MRPSRFTRCPRWAIQGVVLLSAILLTAPLLHADTVYTLNATSPSGDLFKGTITFPTVPIPDPYPNIFTIFTGQVTQTTASGESLDTYTADSSEAEGSIRVFFLNEASNDYGGFFLAVEGSAFASNLTVCTTTHPCDCTPADQCFVSDPSNVISQAARCTNFDPSNYPACSTYDVQEFQTATMTGIVTAATPEPSSLILLSTGALFSYKTARRKRAVTHARITTEAKAVS